MAIFEKFDFWSNKAQAPKWPSSLIQYGGQITTNQKMAPTFP